MEVTTKQLRIQPGRIIELVNKGQNITITYRGKPRAKIIPITNRKPVNANEPVKELFGIWKDRNDINDIDKYLRNIRKGRKF